MQDRHVWLAYTDFSQRAKDEMAFRNHLDDQVFYKHKRWYVRALPLVVAPLFFGGVSTWLLGPNVLKMILWSLLQPALILGILGLTKIYEWHMYGFIGGRGKKLYKQLAGDKMSTDMKLGHREESDHFFDNYELMDQRLRHNIWRFLPHVIELVLYFALFSWLFSPKLVLIAMMTAVPTLTVCYLLVYMTRPRLPRGKAH